MSHACKRMIGEQSFDCYYAKHVLNMVQRFGFDYISCSEPGSSVGIATELPTGRSGDRTPLEGEIFRSCPDLPWGPSRLLYNGHPVFPGVKSGQGVTLTPHPLQVPCSRKITPIRLLPLCAVRPVQTLSACTVQLYLYSPYGP